MFRPTLNQIGLNRGDVVVKVGFGLVRFGMGFVNLEFNHIED